jgi:hypothetical protein
LGALRLAFWPLKRPQYFYGIEKEEKKAKEEKIPNGKILFALRRD